MEIFCVSSVGVQLELHNIYTTKSWMNWPLLNISWLCEYVKCYFFQLLGGAHRLAANNAHQLPLAVILCGASKSAVYGLSTARHLAGHGVRTQVWTAEQFFIFYFMHDTQRSQEGKSENNHIRCNKFITTCTNLKKIRIFKAFYDKYITLKGTLYLKKSHLNIKS